MVASRVTKNYVEPPGLTMRIVPAVIQTTDSGKTITLGSSSSDPALLGFVAQSVIIDARGISSGGVTLAIGSQGDFTIYAPAGTYQSYTLPAYAECVFTPTYDAGTAAGSVTFWFTNYPLIPQSYLPAQVSQKGGLVAYEIGAGAVNIGAYKYAKIRFTGATLASAAVINITCDGPGLTLHQYVGTTETDAEIDLSTANGVALGNVSLSTALASGVCEFIGGN